MPVRWESPGEEAEVGTGQRAGGGGGVRQGEVRRGRRLWKCFRWADDWWQVLPAGVRVTLSHCHWGVKHGVHLATQHRHCNQPAGTMRGGWGLRATLSRSLKLPQAQVGCSLSPEHVQWELMSFRLWLLGLKCGGKGLNLNPGYLVWFLQLTLWVSCWLVLGLTRAWVQLREGLFIQVGSTSARFRPFLLYLPLPRDLLGHWCEKPPECTQSMLVKPLWAPPA